MAVSHRAPPSAGEKLSTMRASRVVATLALAVLPGRSRRQPIRRPLLNGTAFHSARLAVDLTGPRSDGRLVAAVGRHLSTLSADGTMHPFSRGPVATRPRRRVSIAMTGNALCQAGAGCLSGAAMSTRSTSVRSQGWLESPVAATPTTSPPSLPPFRRAVSPSTRSAASATACSVDHPDRDQLALGGLLGRLPRPRPRPRGLQAAGRGRIAAAPRSRRLRRQADRAE